MKKKKKEKEAIPFIVYTFLISLKSNRETLFQSAFHPLTGSSKETAIFIFRPRKPTFISVSQSLAANKNHDSFDCSLDIWIGDRYDRCRLTLLEPRMQGWNKSFFVQTMASHLPFRIYFQPLAHPSLSPSFHSSRGKVGILGSPFSNFFSSLPPPFSLFLSPSPFPPWESPPRFTDEETRVALEYRVDGRTRLIEKITMISMTKGAEGKIDAGSIFASAGRFYRGRLVEIEYSTEGLRSREFTTGFYSPR